MIHHFVPSCLNASVPSFNALISLSTASSTPFTNAGLCSVENPPPVCDALQDPGPGAGFDIDAGLTYKPTSALNASLSYVKARLTRYDTGRVAFDGLYPAYKLLTHSCEVALGLL